MTHFGTVDFRLDVTLARRDASDGDHGCHETVRNGSNAAVQGCPQLLAYHLLTVLD